MHDSLGCSSAHSVNDLGDTQCKEQLNPQRPQLTQTALFCICMNEKLTMCISYYRKKGFKILLCKAENAFFPFRNSEVYANKPQASLTSTRLASIAVPLEHGGNSTAIFSSLEHCMHEFLL